MQLLCQWFRDIIPEKQLLCTAHNPSILDGFDIADKKQGYLLLIEILTD